MTSIESEVYSEIYCYKVIYPNGTFIRVSPDLKASKTGDILECGSVFESSKSLFLDGINYVKLADGRGWVFHSKGETKVLELIEVIKKYEETPVLPPSSSCEKLDFQPRAPAYSRNKNLYWREVRSKVRSCSNFREFSEFVKNGMPNMPTRSSSGSDSPNEQLIRKQLCLITSTTRKGADLVSNVKDLEAHLWVLVHMGGQVNHVMQLIVDEANFYFEKVSPARKNELLSIALEIGAATRVHNTELTKFADILADDVRNFVQRYVIIHSHPDDNHVSLSPNASSSANYKSTSKPLPIGTDSRTVVSPQGKGSPVSAVKKDMASGTPIPPPPSTPTRNVSASSNQSGTWLSSWVCTSPPPAMPEPECREMTEMSSDGRGQRSNNSSARKAPPPPPTPANIFSDVSNYVRRLTSDPDFQFAGLI